MKIIITTRGRTNRQITLDHLPEKIRKVVEVICPEHEVKIHQTNFPDVKVIPHPADINTLAKKRKWIIETWGDYDNKVILLDDDLRFFIRTSYSDWHLRKTTDDELVEGFDILEEKLSEEVPMVSFGNREGNNRKQGGWDYVTRAMCTLGFYIPVMLKECELGRIELRDDFDYTLQLLRKGYKNGVYNTICINQSSFAKGGCAEYRTIDSSNDDAYKLERLHPGLVKAVPKVYKNMTRVETNCSWKKAFIEGQKYRENLYTKHSTS